MNDLQSLYLLWATILNQSQSAEQVLLNTIELFNRLGLKKNFNEGLKSLSYEKIQKAMMMKPCSHYPKEFICGNVKIDNLKDIWNNSKILKQFRELKGNDICNNCEEYEHCRSGCRYRCFADGDINGVDPYCYLKYNKL